VEELQEKFGEFLDDISVKVDEVKKVVSDITGQARTKASEAKKTAKEATG
jgi:hypothetical protein